MFANALSPSEDSPYPAPPRVHWTVLAGVCVILNGIVDSYSPKPYREILNSLPIDAWAFYLCLWIRKLDHDALSPFLCDAYVVVELAFAWSGTWQSPSSALQLVSDILGFAAGVLGIVTIYWVRADLQRHYKEREDFTLILDPVTTLFFSFVYFQYHLYDIADQKLKERRSIAQEAAIEP